MKHPSQGIILGLSLLLGVPTALGTTVPGPAPTTWFIGDSRPPAVPPMRALPEVMRTLTPLASPTDRQVIADNFHKIMESEPTHGLCVSVALVLLPFDGDEGFYHPFLQWFPYALISGDIYSRWGPLGVAQSTPATPADGIVRRWQAGQDPRRLSFASPQDLLARSDMAASVELVEARFATRAAIEADAVAHPWPRYPNSIRHEGCNSTPLSPAGGHSYLADAYLFVRAVVFLPYMANSEELSPRARALWLEQQNNTMMHEMVHLHALVRILSESTAQLKAMAEYSRASRASYIAEAQARGEPLSPRELAAFARPKPLQDGEEHLRKYLDYFKRGFDEEAVQYHAFLGYRTGEPSRRRYDNSGDLPPYMDTVRLQARLQREFDGHEQVVREAMERLAPPPAQ